MNSHKYTRNNNFFSLLCSTLLSIICLGVLPFSSALADQEKTEAKAMEIWIDVRSATEYQQSHIIDAINIPHENIDKVIDQHVETKGAIIHLYCRSGGRAQIAKDSLVKAGYFNITNEGGINDVIRKGYKTLKN